MGVTNGTCTVCLEPADVDAWGHNGDLICVNCAIDDPRLWDAILEKILAKVEVFEEEERRGGKIQ